MAELRCKPGDRALVWRNTLPLACHCAAIGNVVKVERSADMLVPTSLGGWFLGYHRAGPAWSYGPRALLCQHGKPIHALLDCDLVPLPPEDDVRARDAVMERCDFAAPDVPRLTPIETEST